MKIIFDNEKQKEQFIQKFTIDSDECPEKYGLKSVANALCNPSRRQSACRKCWEQSGLEMVVTPKKSALDIIPRDEWELKRWNDLAGTILRCVDKGHAIPKEWLEEYNELSVRVVDKAVKFG